MNDEAILEIMRLKDYLNRTDYKSLQFSEGELTEEEFAPIREERHQARLRIRELEQQQILQ